MCYIFIPSYKKQNFNKILLGLCLRNQSMDGSFGSTSSTRQTGSVFCGHESGRSGCGTYLIM